MAKHLAGAVITGFGKDFPNVDYDTPDYNMLLQLEKNVYQFAGAKNFQELKSLSQALRDKDGRVRSKEDFKAEALKINKEFNGRYLGIEHDSAIGSATMAGKWVEIEQQKEVAPFLRYDTAGDNSVRPSHAELDGIILAVIDAFWSLYYPPNGWGCRCTVTQLLHAIATRADKIVIPADIPDMFKTNLAKNGLVFPEKHPYYVDCPKEVLKQALLLRDNNYSKLTATRDMKANVFVGSLADPSDLKQNIQHAKRLVELQTQDVYIRPHSGEKNVKNPELQIGSLTGDFKTYDGKTSLEKFVRNSVDSANKQTASIPVLIVDTKDYDKTQVWRALSGELSETKRKKNITHVWLLLNKQLVQLKRADIVKGAKQLLP